MTLGDLRKIAEAPDSRKWSVSRELKTLYVVDSEGRKIAGVGMIYDETAQRNAKFIETFNPQQVLELIDELDSYRRSLRKVVDRNVELAARLAAVEKLHPLVKVYDECDHENCTAEPVEVYDYTACTDSLIGYACRACCFQNSEYMVEACPHDLDHADTTETTYCPTIKALKGETND